MYLRFCKASLKKYLQMMRFLYITTAAKRVGVNCNANQLLLLRIFNFLHISDDQIV